MQDVAGVNRQENDGTAEKYGEEVKSHSCPEGLIFKDIVPSDCDTGKERFFFLRKRLCFGRYGYREDE